MIKGKRSHSVQFYLFIDKTLAPKYPNLDNLFPLTQRLIVGKHHGVVFGIGLMTPLVDPGGIG